MRGGFLPHIHPTPHCWHVAQHGGCDRHQPQVRTLCLLRRPLPPLGSCHARQGGRDGGGDGAAEMEVEMGQNGMRWGGGDRCSNGGGDGAVETEAETGRWRQRQRWRSQPRVVVDRDGDGDVAVEMEVEKVEMGRQRWKSCSGQRWQCTTARGMQMTATVSRRVWGGGHNHLGPEVGES